MTPPTSKPSARTEAHTPRDHAPVVGRDRDVRAAGSRGGRIRGRVARIVTGRGFGFIDGDDGEEYFMHKTSVGTMFDDLVEGTRVEFATMHTTKGWRAIDVVRENDEEE